MLIRLACSLLLLGTAISAAESIRSGGPCLKENIARPLRYQPDGKDFVITNGSEFFNRPLYGGNTAFRVDGGDMPEFALYFPGRGGNLRLGVIAGGKTKWLHQAEKIEARYRPGAMVHEIRDPMLGNGGLRLSTLATRSSEGLLAKIERIPGGPDFELCWAFGGMDGTRGRRDGDIGCEPEPVSRFFQLNAERCEGDSFELTESGFRARGKAGEVNGIFPPGGHAFTADASHWDDAARLMEEPVASSATPVLAGRAPLTAGTPEYFLLARPQKPDAAGPGLAALYEKEEGQRSGIAGQVAVDTPDPFINAAAAALNIAADAVWDEQAKGYVHGAVAWRTRLLGWRGVYAGDFLGDHHRTRAHLETYAARQNTQPVPATQPVADESDRLARNENALHTNGDMMNSHYDMNLVGVDALFRHLMWTGDLEAARRFWPVLERHLAWEKRLFRREFGDPALPIYEAYACIWASDDVACHGGGSSHATAYNIWHNRMAAKLAVMLGKDPQPYQEEADLAEKGMRRELWVEERGCFAEFKDLLGRQLVHADPALWTFYHTIDCEVPDRREAWRMSMDIERRLPRIPLTGPGVPEGNFTLPTSNWMPYTWSVNNVVLAESMHGSLACWQTGRPELAFPLFKGAVLDSMFMGLCPGNVGMCTSFDVYRGESQRDFADGAGSMSRALVEGLFGIRPDLLSGEILIRPGFPADWQHASIRHPGLGFSYQRKDRSEVFEVTSRLAKPAAIRLEIPARLDGVAGVTVNGQRVEFEVLEQSVGRPMIAVRTAAGTSQRIEVTWDGNIPASRHSSTPGAFETASQGRMRWVIPPAMEKPEAAATPVGLTDSGFWREPVARPENWSMVDLNGCFNASVSDIFRNEYLSPRSPHVSLSVPKQGYGSWCHPTMTFDVDDSGLRKAAGKSGRIVLPNGIPVATPSSPDARNIAFVSQWDNYPEELVFPLSGKARRAVLMVAGSTKAMQSRLDNGVIEVVYQDGSVERMPLSNPETWWPIDQDYFIDDFAFRHDHALPPRCNLATGKIRILEMETFKGSGRNVPGGAATFLMMNLAPDKELVSLKFRALTNQVVMGLMGVTLERP